MSRMPRNNWNQFGGFPPQGFWPPRRRRRRVRWKFRRFWIVGPLLVLAGIVIFSLLYRMDFDFDFNWDECLSNMGINDTEKFSSLLVGFLVLILVVGALRLLRGNRKDDS